MSNKLANTFANALDSHELVYERLGDDDEIIRIGLPSEKTDGRYFFIECGDSESDIAIKAFNICKFPEDRVAAIYKTCSELNSKFRWVKYYVDESDHTVTVSCDAQVNFDTVEDIGLDLLLRVNHISDEAYGDFMKALYC